MLVLNNNIVNLDNLNKFIMKTMLDFKKILIAVDASSYSQKAAKYGMFLAYRLGAEVALIHVDEPPMVTNIGGDPMMGNQILELPDLMTVQTNAATQLLTQITNDFGAGLTISQFIKTGNIKDEILETANTWLADIIVLGTHSRTGIDHFILGSMAESITRHSVCPVLIVPNKNEEG